MGTKDKIIAAWNLIGDEYNQWDSLDAEEQVEFAIEYLLRAENNKKLNPWCDACLEKDCILDDEDTCAMIRVYQRGNFMEKYKNAVIKQAEQIKLANPMREDGVFATSVLCLLKVPYEC